MYKITYKEHTDEFWHMMDIIHEELYDAGKYPYQTWYAVCKKNLDSKYNATIQDTRSGKIYIVFNNEEDYLAFKIKFPT